jgi:hypothetical protein
MPTSRLEAFSDSPGRPGIWIAVACFVGIACMWIIPTAA